MAEAELSGLEAQVDARIGELLAEWERARSLVELYRDEVLPEARATVESALSSYRVGAVDFLTLVDAQMTVNRYESELHQLLADHGKAVAGLESAVGRTLPRTETMTTTDPETGRQDEEER
jgi:outer membrane protein TolC